LYRNAVLKESENAAIEVIISRYSNAANLHDKTQNQADQQSSHCPGSTSGHCESGHKDDKFKERKCVCDEMHLFKECLYIVTAARKNFPG
jgi:hypothetical protein